MVERESTRPSSGPQMWSNVTKQETNDERVISGERTNQFA